MTLLIYKICSKAEWQSAVEHGTYIGSQDDLRDGFIHFSTAEQLATTLDKHFAGQDNLVLITVDASPLTPLSESLKWEPSRGGELFPHLYAPLPVASARDVQNLKLGSKGHILPQLFDCTGI